MADEQITSNTANIPYVNLINNGSDQAAPSAGRAILYIKSGVAYVRLDTGDPVPVGGAVALAEGRLAIGDGSGELSALALGTEGQVVTADASGFATWDDAPEGDGGGGPTLITEHVVGVGGESTYTFADIPQTYKHLLLRFILRKTEGSGTYQRTFIQFNGDSNTIYHSQLNFSYGAGVWAGENVHDAAQAAMCNTANTITTAGAAVVGELVVPFYTGTVFWKHAHGTWELTSTGDNNKARAGVTGLTWASTAAITSITVFPSDSGLHVEGCRILLYGVD